MLGSTVLDVIVGMAFVFLLVSTLCTALREGLESILKTRAAYLEHGIRALLHDPNGTEVAKQLFNHPLIYSLFLGEYRPGPTRKSVLARGRDLPSYIPSRSFAAALMDLAARGDERGLMAGAGPSSMRLSARAIRENVAALGSVPVQRIILSALDAAKDDVALATKHLEAWFDSAMDRVSGWYKRATQWITLMLALAVTVGLNIDAIEIAQYLYKDEATRSVLVQRASTATNDVVYLERNAREVQAELDKLRLPLGWEAPLPATNAGLTMHVFGWLLTALAATLGAPFWFDVMNKFVVIRSTVKPHQKSPEVSSADKLPARPPAREAPTLAVSMEDPHHEAHVDDDESDFDACDLPKSDTPDDQLPAAEGGVVH